MTAGNILFVDEDKGSLNSIFTTLENEGYQVYQTQNRGQVLNLFQGKEIDLAFVAMDMDGFSGFDVLSQIRSHDSDAKVILYTEHASKEQVVRAFRKGASEFLEIPLESDSLIPIVKQLIEPKPTGKVLQGQLSSMSLASIIQINCEEQNTGVLQLRRRRQSGQIYFNNGRVIHAATEEVSGEEAVYQLLQWQEGSFALEMGRTPAMQTIDAGWSELVLEGMRRMDEVVAEQEIPWGEMVFETDRKGAPTQPEIPQRLVRALSQIDGVSGALICNPDGQLLAHTFEDGENAIGEITRFLTQQAEKMDAILAARGVNWILLGKAEEQHLLLKDEDYLIFLRVMKRTADELLVQSVQATIMRYRD